MVIRGIWLESKQQAICEMLGERLVIEVGVNYSGGVGTNKEKEVGRWGGGLDLVGG